jgi:serine/threonine-protein kinase
MNENIALPKPVPQASAKVPRWLKVIAILVLAFGICATIVCIAFVLYLFAPNVSDLFSPAPAPIEMVMVQVPAGEFTMGNNEDELEKPAHQVYLNAFSIDKHEVTNAQYKKCADAGKCSPPSNTSTSSRQWYYSVPKYSNHPMANVTWEDAKRYCEWAGKRLPTEAEWEKAARGTDGRMYPWGNTFDASKLNSSEGGAVDTTVVGSYPAGASPYGALDMAGNVDEWVADWFDDYPHSTQRNPTGPPSGTVRVTRGGSYINSSESVRVTSRGAMLPTIPGNASGFRCAK